MAASLEETLISVWVSVCILLCRQYLLAHLFWAPKMFLLPFFSPIASSRAREIDFCSSYTSKNAGLLRNFSENGRSRNANCRGGDLKRAPDRRKRIGDRKSTRLNS